MEANNAISLKTLTTVIIVFAMLIGVVICLVMYRKEIVNGNNATKIVHEECEHDWVVTSKYVLLRDSYKTISKCSKCGREIE